MKTMANGKILEYCVQQYEKALKMIHLLYIFWHNTYFHFKNLSHVDFQTPSLYFAAFILAFQSLVIHTLSF